MAKTVTEERLRWVLPIATKEVKLTEAAKLCPYGKRSLERWTAAYRQYGDAGLELKSTARKTQQNETPIRIKEHIIELRRQTKKCAVKLHWQMKKQGLTVPTRTIGEILKREGLVRKYRVKRVKYKYIKALLKPGELLEIDVKYVPGTVEGMQYFQYTAIDRASRWRHLEIYDAHYNDLEHCGLSGKTPNEFLAEYHLINPPYVPA